MHKNAKTKLLNLFILLKKNGIKNEKKFFFGQIDKKKILCYDVFNNKKCFRRG
jgi:hypothetical protein